MSADNIAPYVRVLDQRRRRDFIRVFEADTVRVVAPAIHQCRLPGMSDAQWVYLLDLEALTEAQRGRLIAHIIERFGLSAHRVMRDLNRDGVPILARDTVLFVNGERAEPERLDPEERFDWRLLS